VEIDIFIPELKLGFEYQGEHHFEENSRAGFGSIEEQKFRDEKKIKICSEFGISIIIIPYWWNNNIESLKATILQKFPNLSEFFPRHFISEFRGKSPISPLKNESLILTMNITLSQVWSENINPKGYWISEKFDGIRAIWRENNLFSRFGNKFDVPDWWKIKIPPEIDKKGFALGRVIFRI